YAKRLSFHLTDGSVREIRGALGDYAPQLLLKREFTRVHRSYLVNLKNMRELDMDEFTTVSGEKVPVAKRLHKQIKDEYVQFLSGER
nr:LytTR family transcriptional regulator DNA-binding domain-containing protein [Lachnospiraceae bacterium]